jgi:hypothetical protein
LEQKGAIVVENLDISISESPIRAEEETPGEPADAVVWEDLEQSAGEERVSASFGECRSKPACRSRLLPLV